MERVSRRISAERKVRVIRLPGAWVRLRNCAGAAVTRIITVTVEEYISS